MRSISSGVFTTDQEGRITSFNPAAHEVTGYAFSDVQGRLWQEVFNWHRMGDRRIPTWLRRRCALKWTAFTPTVAVWCWDDRLAASKSRVRSGSGRGVPGSHANSLSGRGMRRREWLANLGEMSAGMAHEIRNPLGALAGAMQMLRQDVGSDETSQG